MLYADLVERDGSWQWADINTRNGMIRLDRPKTPVTVEKTENRPDLCRVTLIGLGRVPCEKEKRFEAFLNPTANPVTILRPEFDASLWLTASEEAWHLAAKAHSPTLVLEQIRELSARPLNLPAIIPSLHSDFELRLLEIEHRHNKQMVQHFASRLAIEVEGQTFAPGLSTEAVEQIVTRSLSLRVRPGTERPVLTETPAPPRFEKSMLPVFETSYTASDWSRLLEYLWKKQQEREQTLAQFSREVQAFNEQRRLENQLLSGVLEKYERDLRTSLKQAELVWPNRIPEFAGLQYRIEVFIGARAFTGLRPAVSPKVRITFEAESVTSR